MNFIYISTLKVLCGLVIGGTYFLYQKIVNLELEIAELKDMVYDHENFIYKKKSKI